MKVKILRPYLDFEEGKTYTTESTDQGKYMIAMGIAKEVVAKNGKPEAKAEAEIAKVQAEAESKPEVAPEAKKEVVPEAKAEVKPAAKKEVKKPIEDEDLELF